MMIFIVQINSNHHNNNNNTLKLNQQKYYSTIINKYYKKSSMMKFQELIDIISYRGEWKYQENKIYPKNQCKLNYFTDDECSDANIMKSKGWKYSWKLRSNMNIQEKNYIENIYNNTFSTKKLCQFFNGTNLLLVGDSITEELYMSLLNYITRSQDFDMNNSNTTMNNSNTTMNNSNTTMNNSNTTMNNITTICYPCLDKKTTDCYITYQLINCNIYNILNFKIIRVRNDRFLLTNITYKDKSFFEYSWIEYLNNTSIMIVNRGAHYENNIKLINDITNTINYITNYYSNILIIWRNTAIGFNEDDYISTRYKEPLNHTQQQTHINHINLPYHWSEFKIQNNLIKKLINNNFLNWNILYWDIFHLTSYRSDSHKDGLHYCLSGFSPIDSWTEIFSYIINIFIDNNMLSHNNIDEII